MILLLLIILTLIPLYLFGRECGCEKDSIDYSYLCDTTKFDNYSKLYWQVNCDSAWLTFENKKFQKVILYSLTDDFRILTGHIGYVWCYEYKNKFIMENKVVSGCCQPHEYYLFDKTNGKLLNNLGHAIFVSDVKDIPIIVSITNSNEEEVISKVNYSYNTLTITNIENGKIFKVDLPNNLMESHDKFDDILYPEEIFMSNSLNDYILKIEYFDGNFNLKKNKNKSKLKTKSLTIDLSKYLN